MIRIEKTDRKLKALWVDQTKVAKTNRIHHTLNGLPLSIIAIMDNIKDCWKRRKYIVNVIVSVTKQHRFGNVMIFPFHRLFLFIDLNLIISFLREF